MQTIRSLNLQRSLGDVLQIADGEPVLLVYRDQPRNVIMSSDEFVRLKVAAGEAVPREAVKSKPTFHRSVEDPLGFDTSDLTTYARQAADTALSGRASDYSDAEAEAAERRWGFK